MDIGILYEDNHLLVVNKPVNMPVQEDSSGDLDMLTKLKDFIKVRDDKPGNVFLALVHRLDRPVGGVMVFGKTSKAASRLSDQLRRQAIDRSYLGVVVGRPKETNGRLVDYLYKDRKTNISYVVDKNHKEAKKAVLDYTIVKSTADYSLAEITLHTGRSHQIRVQTAHMGTPLYGDQKYGQPYAKVGQQIALFAYQLTLTHPTLKESMTFTADVPGTFPWSQF